MGALGCRLGIYQIFKLKFFSIDAEMRIRTNRKAEFQNSYAKNSLISYYRNVVRVPEDVVDFVRVISNCIEIR